MKRFFFIFLTFLIATQALHAQTEVNGSVYDAGKQPMAGCSVWFLQADSIVAGCLTDEEGRFTLKGLAAGSYLCRVTMLGYKAAEQTFSLQQKVRLSTFTLQEDPTLLKEVTVTVDRRDVVKTAAGSMTYYLSERAKQSRTAYEALREIPKLQVDPVMNTIHISGAMQDDKLLILIDGVKRPDYLQVLDPAMIESVEVVESPSARYMGAENVTHILNIHINRAKVRPYVNVNGWGRQSLNTNFGVYNVGAEIGNATSSLYLTTQQFYFKNDQIESFRRSVSGDLWQERYNNQSYNSHSYYVGLGGDRIFSDRHYGSFSLTYIANPMNSDYKKWGRVGYLSDGSSSDMTGWQQDESTFHSANAYLYYKYTIAPRHTLELTGNYAFSSSGSQNESNEVNDFFSNYGYMKTDNRRHSAQLDVDYTKVFNNRYVLTAGSNTSFAATNLDNLADNLPIFDYDRWQEYLYVGFNNNSSADKFKYNFSVGMDMRVFRLNGIKRHYVEWVPAASLAYTFNQTHSLALNYNHQRSEPSLTALNPHNMSTDSLYIQVGNPNLTPGRWDRIRLAYRLNYKKLFVEPFVQETFYWNLVTAVGSVEDNIYTNTYVNTGSFHVLNAGISINYNLPFGNLYGSSYFQKRYDKEMVFTPNNGAWVTNFSANFFYKQFSLNVNVGGQTATYDRNSKTKGNAWSSASLAWNLPKGWQVSVTGEGFIYPKLSYKTWVQQENYQSYSTNLMKDRNLRFLVGVTYTFRNKAERKQRQQKRFYSTDSEIQGM